jgi:hypothetical protein
METDVAGLRALGVYGAFHDEVGRKKELYGHFVGGNGAGNGGARGPEALAREVRVHRANARRVTPLVKYLAAEKAVELARRCLQIHGGNGYMREFGAEKLVRDALVMPIYEGTSQIQALMATKDTLTGILRAPKELFKGMALARWRAMTARDGLERRLARLQQLVLGAEQHLITRTLATKAQTLPRLPVGSWAHAVTSDWDPRRDFAYALLHAERLTRLLADHEIAAVLWEQAQRHPERRTLLERHLDRAEPRARYLHDEITRTGRRLISSLAAAPETGNGQQATGNRQ